MVIPPGVFPAATTYGNLTAYPQSGTYGDIINALFTGADSAQKQTLWSSFLWSKGLAIAPGDNSLVPDLVNYIINFKQYFPKEPITFPTDGPYGSVLQAYYGSRSDEEKQSIWQSFLSSEGLTTNPPDDSKVADFVKYISGTYGASSQQSLSPQEIAKRQLLLQTFNAVLQMLSTIQNTVSVQSANLVFYSLWQQEYTKMLTQTPVYVAAPDSGWHPNATVPASFTFGYNKISVDDIAGYLAQAQASGNMSASFPLSTIAGAGGGDDSSQQLVYTFQFTNNKPVIKISIVGNDGGFIGFTDKIIDVTTPTPTPGKDPTPGYKSAWSTAIIDSITKPPIFQGGNPPLVLTYSPTAGMGTIQDFSHDGGAKLVNTFGQLTISWRDREPYPDPASGTGTVDSAKAAANTAKSEARSEINSLLQQYLENTRSRRKVIQTVASTAQTNLSGSKQSISSQADLLTLVVQTMNSVVSSIFR